MDARPPALRWSLAGAGGQGALFEDLVERHMGGGEYRGMEFLHVNARRIINEVPPASRVPFRYTINAYRGCSHACTYCLAGDTAVLMAGGATRRLADLAPGDVVVGTVRRGGRRRYAPARVLDHWRTRQPAWQVVLSGGGRLTAGEHHRLLTGDGWKFVGPAAPDAAWRAHLTPGDVLAGPARADAAGAGGDTAGGGPVEPDARLTVVAVAPLGREMEMFDITTSTGDFVAGGAVSHNCFARPTHEFLGLNAGDDFERRIVVKINAVERLRAELAPSRWRGEAIAMGTNTDPYQRCEAKYRLTRGIVEILAAARNPFSILTKSTLILRDLDLLSAAARTTDVRAAFSIGTLDDEVWRLTEPGTPHPRQRVAAVARLSRAGVRCGVLVAPVLPGLSDDPGQIEAVVSACVEAGAAWISPLLLHLRPGVREHWMEWLAATRPDLAGRYQRLYPGPYAARAAQDGLARQVAEIVARHGGTPPPPGPQAESRTPEVRGVRAPGPPAQLALDV